MACAHPGISDGGQLEFAGGCCIISIDIAIVIVSCNFVHTGIKTAIVVNAALVGPVAGLNVFVWASILSHYQ